MQKLTTAMLICALAVSFVAVLPSASASTTCTTTELPGGAAIVTCDTDGDGLPNTVCFRPPGGVCFS